MKRRTSKKHRFAKQTRNLFAKGLFSYDKLEPKHLLAGVAGVDAYQPTHVVDPFAQDAVTYKEMVARAGVTPFMQGELVVAVSAEQGPQFDQWLNSINWSQMMSGGDVAGVAINSTQTMMTVNRPDNTSVALVHVTMPENTDIFAAMQELDQGPSVLWSSPNFYQDADPREFTPNDPSYGSQYHHPLMDNNLAWDITLGDPSIIIGITDDGVDINHVDLSANIYHNPGETPGDGIDNDGNGYVDDYNGWDFSSNDNNPNHTGGDYHGTHVSGIAAGRTNNGIGIAGTAGGASIMPLRFYGSGPWTASVINETFTYAADNGAKIVSTSYNIDGWVGDAVFTAGLQYLYDSGAIHVNSAGNNSSLNPARQAFEQSLLIASTNSSDTLSSFSNYGIGVDMAAPGESILSTLPGNSYGLLSGTSMAAPNASGTAALIWSAHPTWTRDQVVAQMLATGDNIDAQNPSRIGLLGGGRVNAHNALTMTLDNPQVANVSDLPGDGVFLDNTTIGNFSVKFDQVMDPASINAAGVFELRSAGADGIFGNADDTVYTLDTDTYMIGTNQLDFDIAEGPLNYGHYRFTIAATAQNPFMDALDGDGNGTGGDAYVQEFFISPPPEGVVTFDRPSYLVNDTIVISVGDANAVGPLLVDVTTNGGDSETVVLNSAGFGRFEATINTASNTIVTGDGVLQVALGNVVTVTYNDLDDGTGNPGISTDTANIANVVQFDAVDTPAPITDFGTTTSVIPIAIAGTVADLDLQLDITHTYDGDLSATLTSPTGLQITLFNRIGGSGNNFTQTYFDDEASTSIGSGSPPFTGHFRPAGSFSSFDTGAVQGNWTLRITDNAGADQGTLNSWSLFVDVIPSEPGIVIQSPTPITEGDVGSTTVDFTVNLSSTATTLVELDYATTTAGYSNPATPGFDFEADAGTLVFQPGQQSKTISVTVYGDRFKELNEEFGIVLSNAVGGNITSGNGSVVIDDNDDFALGMPVDFGPQDSVVDASSIGFIVDAYSPELGMGWQNATGLTTGTQLRGTDMTRDFVSAEDAEFVIDVANGDYEVTVFIGIVGRLEPFDLTIEGTLYHMRPSSGPNVYRTFAANVADGTINVQMDGGAGFDNTARISGLVVNEVGGRPSDSTWINDSILAANLQGESGPYIATDPIRIVNPNLSSSRADTTAFYNGSGGSLVGALAIESTDNGEPHCPYMASDPIQIINGSRTDTTKFYTASLRQPLDVSTVDESIKINWMNDLADELFS